jgi:hypothetical protein
MGLGVPSQTARDYWRDNICGFMLAKLHTFALVGIEAQPVEVEIDVSPGAIPIIVLVGGLARGWRGGCAECRERRPGTRGLPGGRSSCAYCTYPQGTLQSDRPGRGYGPWHLPERPSRSRATDATRIDPSRVLKKGDRHLAASVSREETVELLGASPLFQRAPSAAGPPPRRP